MRAAIYGFWAYSTPVGPLYLSIEGRLVASLAECEHDFRTLIRRDRRHCRRKDISLSISLDTAAVTYTYVIAQPYVLLQGRRSKYELKLQFHTWA